MATVISAERRARLLAILERDGAIRLEEAAADLDVSTMTVRRDLVDLELDGLVQRVRGGAVAPVRAESFAQRLARGAGPKREIARKALEFVPSGGGAIAVDASSTAGTLLGAIGDTRLIIATNSTENHLAAHRIPGSRAVLIGGELEEETDSFVGALACRAASAIDYERFFTSASAVDADRGSSEVTIEEAQVKRAFVGASAQTVLLVDSTKLGRRALAHALDWDEVAVMITDLAPEDARLDAFRALVDLR